MDKIAVLIPCYNESKTIKKVVEDYKRILPEATIYVYDNNSSGSGVSYDRKTRIYGSCGKRNGCLFG